MREITSVLQPGKQRACFEQSESRRQGRMGDACGRKFAQCGPQASRRVIRTAVDPEVVSQCAEQASCRREGSADAVTIFTQKGVDKQRRDKVAVRKTEKKKIPDMPLSFMNTNSFRRQPFQAGRF